MKKGIKRIVPILLVLILALGLCACGGPTTAEKLNGTWQGFVQDGDAESILDELSFTEDEISLADTDKFGYIDEMVFNAEDNTYTVAPNNEATQAYLADYFDELIVACFEAKDDLSMYGGELDAATTLEEFQAAYADLFGYATIDELTADFAQTVADFYSEDSDEAGTFTAENDTVIFTVDGESEGKKVTITFTNDDTTLTVEFSDMTVEYTKK